MYRRSAFLLAAVMATASPSPAGTQELPPAATVAGRVRAADSGEPIRFTLIYLVAADSAGAAWQATVTDSAGVFAFRAVPPGEYHLRILRIGYEPEPGAPFRVSAGERFTAELSSLPRPVPLPPIRVSGDACYGADELRDAPRLAKLWRQAAIAAEARRLFDRAYRYTVAVHEEFKVPIGSPSSFFDITRMHRDSDYVHVNVPSRAPRLEEHGADLGYGMEVPGGLRVTAPELPELFGASFLRTHCLTEERGGRREWRIGFRPTVVEPGRVELRGVVVLDAAFAVDRLEFQYFRGGVRFARGTLRYGDVGVPGGQVRFARKLEVEGVTPHGSAGWYATTRMDHYRGFARDTLR